MVLSLLMPFIAPWWVLNAMLVPFSNWFDHSFEELKERKGVNYVDYGLLFMAFWGYLFPYMLFYPILLALT